MSERRQTVVLDASVGVKWFRDEAGSRRAYDLARQHADGVLLIAVDQLFFYEVLGATSRGASAAFTQRVWNDLEALELAVVPLGAELAAAAADVRARYGCSLYDSFSAGLAEILEAPLYSADERAHGTVPWTEIIGE